MESITVQQILNFALPYSADEQRCGLLKQRKTAQRIKLAALIQQWHEQKTTGAHVDASASKCGKTLA